MSEVSGAVADALANAGQPPAGQPPVAQPPAGQPPVQQPPAGQPPTGEPPALDRWQDKFLEPELRSSDALARYPTIDAMAKGLIETQNWARGRVSIPKADDATGFEEFASKIRPEKADDYQILGPDGAKSETGEAFRQTFHDVGLHPLQAQKLTEKWNQYQADIVSKATQSGKDEVHAIELELGPQGYNQRLAAVDSMLKGAGIDVDDIAVALEQVGGAGKALRGLFTLAEKTGELAKVDGASIQMRMGNMTAEAAQAEVNRMSGDPLMAKKIEDKTTPEYARRKALMEIIAKG